MKSERKRPAVVELLLAKYQVDAERFREYMPDVAQLLDQMGPGRRIGRGAFGLTESERTARLAAFQAVLAELELGTVPREKAIEGLEHCASLIEDDHLPEEADFQTLVRLLKAAIGKAPSSWKANTTVPVAATSEDSVAHRVAVVRGVTLNLTWDMHLVSVSVAPRRHRERSRLLAFVGSGRDSAPDVAEHHDEYVASGSPHAAP